MAGTSQITAEALKAEGEAIIPDLLYKLQTASGAGEHVAPNSVVEITYKVFVRGQMVLESEEKTSYKQQLERILPAGLSIALSTMRRGERALIWMDSMFAFGENSILLAPEVKIPKGSKLVFEVELISWAGEAVSRLRFKRAKQCPCISHIEDEVEKAEGLISREKHFQALSTLMHCMHATRSLRIDAQLKPKEEKARQKLDRMITARAADCAYTAGKYPLAVTLSKEALEMDRFDPYMNYVCGKAYFSLGHIELALSFTRTALFKDIANEAYARKVEEIERHQKLLARDIEEDFAKDDFEQFAEYCLERIKQKEESLSSDIGEFISQQLEDGPRRAVVGGGFRPRYLEGLVDELAKDRQLRVMYSEPDCFEVVF